MANHANFAQTTLGAAITDTSSTSITVTSEAGFPAVPFIISVDTEAMLVTNVATTTWTVTRGYEGSTAATHLNGAAVYHDWSAGEANSAVLGPSSATDAHLAVFDGATGKLIKDGGAVPAAGLPTTGGTMTGAIVPADHGTASDPEVVAVVYGTGDPPSAATVPEGTLWVKYTA